MFKNPLIGVDGVDGGLDAIPLPQASYRPMGC